MVTGDWNRALNQLKVAAELDAGALPCSMPIPRRCQCEGLRAEVFSGVRSPLVFGEPLPWIAASSRRSPSEAQGNGQQPAALRVEAPRVRERRRWHGEWAGIRVDRRRRLAPRPILEVLLNGAYYWCRRAHPQRRHRPPSDARDLVWLPAQFTWAERWRGHGLRAGALSQFPERSPDDAVRLARKTEWTALGAGIRSAAVRGSGQRC